MKRKVISFIQKHQLLKKNATVLIAVSGGPDSMALLHFFKMLQQEWHLRIIVLTMDHQLRGEESKEDAAYVEKYGSQLNLEVIRANRDVARYQKNHRLSTQVAAREVRYQFFQEQMKAHNADFLALAQHGDDQIETMLMGLVRSTSTSALSGIPVKRPFAGGFLVRPFLCITKDEINNYCKQALITPRIDPTNKETDYTRNYFRKYVVGRLKEKNQNIHTTVQHLSERLKEDEAYLTEQARTMLKSVVNIDNEARFVSFFITYFQSYQPTLQRRTYHLILNCLYHQLPKQLSYVHEDLFFDLLYTEESNRIIDFPNDLKIEKSYGEVHLYFQHKLNADYSYRRLLQIPDTLKLTNKQTIISCFTNEVEQEDPYIFTYPKDELVLPLHVRTRLPGDRMTWHGLAGSKKIKDIFIDEKIPRNKRSTWPIVTDHNGEILWLVGLRKRHVPQGQNESDSYIKIQLKKSKD